MAADAGTSRNTRESVLKAKVIIGFDLREFSLRVYKVRNVQ
jgi:hypothetical protein